MEIGKDLERERERAFCVKLKGKWEFVKKKIHLRGQINNKLVISL